MFDLKSRRLTLATMSLAVVLGMTLTGCSVTEASPKSDPGASAAAQPGAAPSQASEPSEEPADDGVYAFGDTVTYEDGVSISVSKPASYKPTEYAAGTVKGQKAIVVQFVVTNGSKEAYDPTIMTTASSGGEEASGIFDSDGPKGDIGLGPSTKVLPGKTVKWLQAWSVANPADITLEITAGFEYADAIFTNSK